MKGMEAKQVMNGSQGELWIDGDYMAQITEFKAGVTLDKAEVHDLYYATFISINI